MQRDSCPDGFVSGRDLQLGTKLGLPAVLRQGTISEAAEKFDFGYVLKGHSFSCAVQALYFCHPEATLVAEGSAFSTLSAASSVVPNGPLIVSSRGDDRGPHEVSLLRFLGWLSRRGICFFDFIRSLFRHAAKHPISMLVLSLGLVSAATAQTSTKPTPKSAAWKEYCHPAYGFCFKYPSSWISLGPIFDGNGIVVAPAQKQDRTLWDEVTVALMIPPPEGDEDPVTIDQAIERAVSSVRESGQNFDTVQRRQRAVDGNPAQVVELHYFDKSSAREWIEELVFVEGPDSEIYSAGLKCAPASLAHLEPLFTHIVDSWTLPGLEQPPGPADEAAPAGKSTPPPKSAEPKVLPKPNP